jgi:release factor glutamine methyltransferase
MRIKQALSLSTKKFLKFSTSPALDAEVLFSFVLKKEKAYLYSSPEKNLTKKQAKKFKSLVIQRTKGMPIAYLAGRKEFLGLEFLINRNVLIPRPETETLVEIILKQIKNKKDLNILDVGTGSGCIIVSLAKKLFAHSRELENRYLASDISHKAIGVAKKNAKKHKAKILFKSGDLLDPWKKEKIHVLIANLPYGWKQWKNNLSTDTIGLKFEPQEALFTSNRGLFLIKKIIKQVAEKKQKPFLIFLEFDPRQAKQIKNLTKKYLPDFLTNIFMDLAGRQRFVLLAQKYS